MDIYILLDKQKELNSSPPLNKHNNTNVLQGTVSIVFFVILLLHLYMEFLHKFLLKNYI